MELELELEMREPDLSGCFKLTLNMMTTTVNWPYMPRASCHQIPAFFSALHSVKTPDYSSRLYEAVAIWNLKAGETSHVYYLRISTLLRDIVV